MAAITPIRASIWYDDLAGLWKMHASRDRRDGASNRYERPEIEDAISILVLIARLLEFWALIAGTSGNTRNGVEGAENLAAFQALIAAAVLAEAAPAEVPASTPETGAIDYDAIPEYDGGDDSWGASGP